MSYYFASGNKLKILLHLVVWAVLFILPTYLLYGNSDRDHAFMYEVWFQLACYAVVFYLSYLWLAPRLFFSGRQIRYFISAALLIITFTTLFSELNYHFDPVFRDEVREGPPPEISGGGDSPDPFRPPRRNAPPPPVRNWPIFNFMLTSCLVTGISLGLRFSEKLILNEKQRKEAEKEKLHTELSFLKHQINPHFLFNTLNSIYSLALIKSDKTAEAVMKLSDMMHYVIQDVEHEMVPLEMELEYLNHYVEFQKIRLNEKAEVVMTVDGDPKPYEIPPMILVPFVENAFKYGTSSHENARIRIEMILLGHTLAFRVSNPIFPGRENRENFGIGIQNTRQRLNLIFPGRHKLELANDGKMFNVNLEISLV